MIFPGNIYRRGHITMDHSSTNIDFIYNITNNVYDMVKVKLYILRLYVIFRIITEGNVVRIILKLMGDCIVHSMCWWIVLYLCSLTIIRRD